MIILDCLKFNLILIALLFCVKSPQAESNQIRVDAKALHFLKCTWKMQPFYLKIIVLMQDCNCELDFNRTTHTTALRLPLS